jgi:hypothetical protein
MKSRITKDENGKITEFVASENALEEIISLLLPLNKSERDVVIQAAREFLGVRAGPTTHGDALRLLERMGLAGTKETKLP